MAKRARAHVNGTGRRLARQVSAPTRMLSLTPPPSQAVVVSVSQPPLPPQGPSPESLALFQAGMEALQRHGYADAAAHFRALLDGFAGERALLDRTRVYLDLCERELARRPASPRTVEDRLTAATIALNQDDDAQAEALAAAAIEESPRHDLALYLLAAVNARRGDQDVALDFLGRAFAARPDMRAQVRHDPDFAGLRHSDAFRSLLEAPAVQTRPSIRVARRGANAPIRGNQR